MKKCPKCGEDLMIIQKNNEISAIFCSKCGFEWFSEAATDPLKGLNNRKNNK